MMVILGEALGLSLRDTELFDDNREREATINTIR